MIEDKKSRFFYGYVIVAAGFITQLLMLGAFFSFGIFFKPISSELGWTRATTSAAYSLSSLLFGSMSIVSGRLTDKYGPKVVLIVCGLFLGTGYLLTSQVNSVWQFYLFYGVIMGTGMSGVDIPILATVARWFDRKRGIATGITKTGAGIGILLVPILANWLISGYGWRNAYAIIGVVAMIGVILVALLFRRDPGQMGQLPDGDTKIKDTEPSIDTHQFSIRRVLGMKQFWIFSGMWFSISFCVGVIIAHIVPHVTDLGISATIAATIVGAIGGFSIIGRLGMGFISDRLGNKVAFIIALSLLVIALVWLQFAREVWMLYLFAAIYGIAHGAFFTLFSPMVAELFGIRSLGTILGVVFAVGIGGTAISPLLAGYIFDITGSYQIIFLILLALSIIAIILILFLRPVQSEALREIHS